MACLRSTSIILGMVIDMNEVQVRTMEQVRQVLAGTQALEFRAAHDDGARYLWIASVLGRLGYRQRGRAERGLVRRYVERLSGYSRAQVTRLVARWMLGRALVKGYRAPPHAFHRRYTAADIALLAKVDQTLQNPAGPRLVCVLRRQRDVYGDAGFARLAELSVSHVYNLRRSAGYRAQRVVHTKTRPAKAATIGARRAPAPEGRPGFIRIDSVHQGDWDGTKGLYHINAVDCVTQWEVVATVEAISEAYLLPVLAQMLEQFPFGLQGFHADNGSEYVNYRVAKLLNTLHIEFTRSRPRHSNDNGLAETKNAAVVRKIFGYAHIPQRHAARFNAFCCEHLNPYLNLHRPCQFAIEIPDAKKPGRIKRMYRHQDVMTPLDKLATLPQAEQCLRPGITLAALRTLALMQTDLQAAEQLNQARQALFEHVRARTG